MWKRGLLTAMAVAGVLGVVPAVGRGDDDLKKQILSYTPAVKGAPADYDKPADAKAVEACKIEIPEAAGRLPPPRRPGQGPPPVRRQSKPQSKQLDQWSYYQDGFEVYREVDLDGDNYVDEARWLNAGGTRVASVKYLDKAYVIAGWKRISAEEASKVLVQGLVGGDLDLVESVMATPEELEALGVPASEQERARAGQKGRAAELTKLRQGLAGWTAATVWLRLDAAYAPPDPAGRRRRPQGRPHAV